MRQISGSFCIRPLRPLRPLMALAGAVAIALCIAPGARANDGFYGLGTSGLVLQHSRAVGMRNEVLHITRERIDVAYTFGTSRYVTEDTRMLVAFPLPEMPLGDDNVFGIGAVEGLDLIDFRIWVDGQPVTPQIEAKALVAGVDLTDHLRRHSISPSIFEPGFYDRLMALPDAAKAELVDLGLIHWERFKVETSDGLADIENISPRWSLKLTYYWWQVFPADREISIRHSYRPVPGGGFADPEDGMPYYGPPYCVDAAQRVELAAYGKPFGSTTFRVHDIHYILETARSWAGPIGDFTLIVEHGPEDVAIASCFDGLTETAPGRYEFHAEEYVPQSDLAVLFFMAFDEGE